MTWPFGIVIILSFPYHPPFLPDILPEQEREKIKQFDESEKKRYKAELQKQEKKFEKQLDSLRIRHESTLKELEQLQNEKRKMLMEHETLKLRELEAQYSDELKEWKVRERSRMARGERRVLALKIEDLELVWSQGVAGNLKGSGAFF